MKRLITATTLSLFALAPAAVFACGETMDDHSASAEPPAAIASTSAPEATKVPAAAAVKTSSNNLVKKASTKPKPVPADQKLAAATANEN